MPDAIRPGDSGDWLRAKNIDQTATEVGRVFDALAPNAITSNLGASSATGLAVVVLNAAAATGTATIAGAVTAHQGSSGTQAWPVAVSGPVNVGTIVAVSVSAIPSVLASISALPSVAVSAITMPALSVSAIAAVSVSAIPSIVASVSAIPAISAIQSGAWTANVSVSANVSQLVSVSAIPSIAVSAITLPAVSVSAIAAVSVSAIPAVSIGTIVQPLAVQPRATGNPTTVSFSMTASGSTTLVGSTAGTRLIIKAYGVFNGDTTIHDFAVLNGASNSVAIPAFLAPGGGGHNIAFADPFPMASNVGLAVGVGGVIGTRAVVGYFELGHVTTA